MVPEKKKTEDTNKWTLLAFKTLTIHHNTLLTTFIKLLETVSKGLFRNRSQNLFCDQFLKRPLLTVSRSFMNITNSVLWRMSIILKANKVNVFVSSVVFVFWYHSLNILDTPCIFPSYKPCTCLFVTEMVFFTCAHCGESLKKSKVEKHYQTFCSRKPVSVTCIDCCKDFRYWWLQFCFTCLVMKFTAFIKPREWCHFHNYSETWMKHNLDIPETCLSRNILQLQEFRVQLPVWDKTCLQWDGDFSVLLFCCRQVSLCNCKRPNLRLGYSSTCSVLITINKQHCYK
jgi:hypothetical protein